MQSVTHGGKSKYKGKRLTLDKMVKPSEYIPYLLEWGWSYLLPKDTMNLRDKECDYY